MKTDASSGTHVRSLFQSPAAARVLPFLAYMAFIGVLELADLLGIYASGPESATVLYPAKAALTACALWFCLPRCPEFRLREYADAGNTLFSLVTGIIVFVLWIHLDQPWARIGTPAAFMPELASEGAPRMGLFACRFIGAAVLVPLAEELFWRSWLIRTVEAKDFLSVPVGRPHLFSFVVVSVLFALEHHLVLAGLMAGIAYTLVLYRTRSVAQCVLSHAVTNAALGIWVMMTGNWSFW